MTNSTIIRIIINLNEDFGDTTQKPVESLGLFKFSDLTRKKQTHCLSYSTGKFPFSVEGFIVSISNIDESSDFSLGGNVPHDKTVSVVLARAALLTRLFQISGKECYIVSRDVTDYNVPEVPLFYGVISNLKRAVEDTLSFDVRAPLPTDRETILNKDAVPVTFGGCKYAVNKRVDSPDVGRELHLIHVNSARHESQIRHIPTDLEMGQLHPYLEFGNDVLDDSAPTITELVPKMRFDKGYFPHPIPFDAQFGRSDTRGDVFIAYSDSNLVSVRRDEMYTTSNNTHVAELRAHTRGESAAGTIRFVNPNINFLSDYWPKKIPDHPCGYQMEEALNRIFYVDGETKKLYEATFPGFLDLYSSLYCKHDTYADNGYAPQRRSLVLRELEDIDASVTKSMYMQQVKNITISDRFVGWDDVDDPEYNWLTYSDWPGLFSKVASAMVITKQNLMGQLLNRPPKQTRIDPPPVRFEGKLSADGSSLSVVLHRTQGTPIIDTTLPWAIFAATFKLTLPPSTIGWKKAYLLLDVTKYNDPKGEIVIKTKSHGKVTERYRGGLIPTAPYRSEGVIDNIGGAQLDILDGKYDAFYTHRLYPQNGDEELGIPPTFGYMSIDLGEVDDRSEVLISFQYYLDTTIDINLREVAILYVDDVPLCAPLIPSTGRTYLDSWNNRKPPENQVAYPKDIIEMASRLSLRDDQDADFSGWGLKYPPPETVDLMIDTDSFDAVEFYGEVSAQYTDSSVSNTAVILDICKTFFYYSFDRLRPFGFNSIQQPYRMIKQLYKDNDNEYIIKKILYQDDLLSFPIVRYLDRFKNYCEPELNYDYVEGIGHRKQLKITNTHRAGFEESFASGFRGEEGKAIWEQCRGLFVKYGGKAETPEQLKSVRWFNETIYGDTDRGYRYAVQQIKRNLKWMELPKISFTVSWNSGYDLYVGDVVIVDRTAHIPEQTKCLIESISKSIDRATATISGIVIDNYGQRLYNTHVDVTEYGYDHTRLEAEHIHDEIEIEGTYIDRVVPVEYTTENQIVSRNE